MARKEIQTNIEVSPDEEKLASLSSSIEAAKTELVETGKINKKVLADIEDNKKALVELKTAKDSLSTEISNIKDEKERVQNNFRLTQDSLLVASNNKAKAEKDLADFKLSSELEKDRLQSEINSLQGLIVKIKTEIRINEEVSRVEKEKLVKEISELNSSLSILLKKEADQKEKNNDTSVAYIRLSDSKKSLQEDFDKISNETSRQREILKGLEQKVIEIDTTVNDRKLQIQEINDNIIAKKAEFKAQETKLFAIKEKEAVLDQKERFIKAQFERAGVRWEE